MILNITAFEGDSTRQKSTDYVKYISYIFIDKYVKSEKSYPTGILYNKYMTLVNRKLIDEVGTDIKLPHCWYRWGDEVVRYTMPYLEWNHDDPTETLVSFTGTRPMPIRNDSVLSYAESFADDFIRNYSGSDGVEMAIDDVYENVPYRFQNDYRMLRENLKISRKNIPISNHIDMVESLYRDAMKHFPKKEFSAMSKQVGMFSKVFELAVEKDLSTDRLQDISECFWFYFCYHLRLDKKGHYNVPESTLRIWMDAIPENLDRYEMMMQNYVNYLCPNGSDDPLFDDMLKQRRKRLDDIDELFANMGQEQS